MFESPPRISKVRSLGVALAVFAFASGARAAAPPGAVTKLEAHEDGASTVVRIHGTTAPMFTVYKLEKPERVVVDVANAELSGDGAPVSVNTWAVGQVSAQALGGSDAQIVRVFVGFARPSTYRVSADANDVVVTVTAKEPKPDPGKDLQEMQSQAAAERAAAVKAKADADAKGADADARAADAAKAEQQLAMKSADLDKAKAALAAMNAEAAARLADAQKRTADADARTQKAADEEKAAAAAQAKAADEEKTAAAAQAKAERAASDAQATVAAAEKRRADANQAAKEAAQAAKDAEVAGAADAARKREEAEQAAARAVAVKKEAEAAAATAEARRSEAEQARSAAEGRRSAAEQAISTAEGRRQAAEDAAQAASQRRTEAEQAAAAASQQAASASQRKSEAEAAAEAATARQGDAEKARVAAEAARAQADAQRVAAEKARDVAQTEMQRAEAAQQVAVAARQKEEDREQEVAARRAEEEQRTAAAAQARAVSESAAARADDARRQSEVGKAAAEQALAQMTAAKQAAEQAASAASARRADAEKAAADADRIAAKAGATEEEIEKARAEAARLADERKGAEAELARRTDELSASQAKAKEIGAERDRLASDAKAARAELDTANASLKIEETKRQAVAAARADEEQKLAAAQARLAEDETKAADAEKRRAAADAAAAQAETTRAKAEADARALKQAPPEPVRVALIAPPVIVPVPSTVVVQAPAPPPVIVQVPAKPTVALIAPPVIVPVPSTIVVQMPAPTLTAPAKPTVALIAPPVIVPVPSTVVVQVPAPAPPAPAPAKPVVAYAAPPPPAPSKTVVASAPPPAPAPTSAAPTPKPVVAIAAVPPPPATGRAVRVKDVDYVDRDETGRVTFELSGPAAPKVIAASGKQAILEIPSAELPPALERSLDTSEFSGPVTSIASYRDPRDTTRVRLVVDLAQPAEGTLAHDGNRWTWDFPKSAAARGRRTTVAEAHATSFAPPVVGGYGAASTPIASQTVAQTTGGGLQSGQRITIDLKEADIHNLMRLFAQAGNVDIVVPDDVTAKVTVKLTQVPWREAMEVILASKGYWYKQVGRIIRVAPRATLITEDEDEEKRRRAAITQEAPSTEVFTLNYAKASDVLPQISALVSPRGKVLVDTRTNSLVITEISGNRAAMVSLLRRLDTQTPQIQIEARVVEARSTFERDIGVQWGYSALASATTGNPTGLIFPSTIGTAGGATDADTSTAGVTTATQTTIPNFAVNLPAAVGTGAGGAVGFTFGSVGGNFNIALRLSAAESTGVIRIVSAPKIMVLNNLSATITQGTSIPIEVVSATGVQTQFVPADLSLKVTPHVSQRDCSIVLEANIKKNEADFVDTGARGDPSILRKEATTTLLINDGETSVIGGIYTRNEGESYKKVPFFADIPIIGWFFRSKTETDDRTEVLIFLTPKIVNRASLHCESAPGQ